MKIYLIRHGESIDANLGLSQSKDSGLSQLGKQKISKRIKYFNSIPFTKIYFSPWKRARQTAELLFKNQPKEEVSYIHEYIKPSSIVGIKKELAKKFWTDNLENVIKADWQPGDGESFNDILARVEKFILKLKEHDDTDIIGVVSHGTFFRHLVGRLLSKSDYNPNYFASFLRHIELDNLGHIHLELDKMTGSTKLIRWHGR